MFNLLEVFFAQILHRLKSADFTQNWMKLCVQRNSVWKILCVFRADFTQIKKRRFYTELDETLCSA